MHDTIDKPAYSNERDKYREIEQKFIPLFPEEMDVYRAESVPIEQYYLSHPDEPYSLRLRETTDSSGGVTHEATLKDRGTYDTHGLNRLEVSCTIDTQTYVFYTQYPHAVLRKLRSEPIPGVIIDYYENGHIQVESENPNAWRIFNARHDNRFQDVTGSCNANNEWLSHLLHRQAHGGQEAISPPEMVSIDPIVMAAHLRRPSLSDPVTIRITGRSGSGKSTLINQLRERFGDHGLTVATLSTDDYHRGSSWLRNHNNGKEWDAWDEPIVYDTIQLAQDLARLRRGEHIPRRSIDWSIAEPAYSGHVTPSHIILIEGIYAGSPDITRANDIHYEIPTPLATCVGRRIERDTREGRANTSDPEYNLRYILEHAEPAYRRQP